MIFFFVSYAILLVILIPIVIYIQKKKLIHLGSFWYFNPKKNQLIQFFNFQESLAMVQIRSQGKKKMIKYIHTTMRSAVLSDKLPEGTRLHLKNHLIKHLFKDPKIKVMECTYIKKKHLWEVVFFTGIFGYLKMLCSKQGRKSLWVSYYNIEYVRVFNTQNNRKLDETTREVMTC